MIETVTALVALMTSVQMWMTDPAVAWPVGRSWAFPVKYTITDAQLEANRPVCCRYLTHPGSSIVMRVNDIVYLLKN